ncbi:MAG: ImmA/IrrE family metallo-endopeptidase [Candidatus Electrothrix sp. AW5]|nr:ImmA/IrrE family metallo-endopeptidase [Candidatus Electrothrix gigas]
MVSTAYATSASSSAYKALWEEDYKSRYFDFYGFVDETYTVSSNHFFSSLSRIGTDSDTLKSLSKIESKAQKIQLSVPYKTMKDIEKVTSFILSTVGYQFGQVPLDKICELLEEQFGLVVVRNFQLDKGVLGQISFGPDIILIDDYQASTQERTRFTLAHELGHFFLAHQAFIARETCHEEDIDLERVERMNLKDVRRMEWQANFFASSLLLPVEQFRREFFNQLAVHNLSDRGYGLFYLDNQRCNINAFYSITSALMKKFYVSRSVIKIRLLKLGYLNEAEEV